MMNGYPVVLMVLMVLMWMPQHGVVVTHRLAAAPRAQGASSDQQPLAKDEIMDLVEAGMDSAVLAKKVEKLGINFEPTDAYLQALRRAGAQDVLIQALRNANPKPLTQKQVLALVAQGLPTQRAASIVKQHGIDFVADEKFYRTLSIAGADDILIAAVRQASLLITGELLVETSAGAVVYLDGESQGQADGKGVLDLRVRLGAHTIKISQEGRQDFEQSITVRPGETNRLEANLRESGMMAGTARENPRDGMRYRWIPPGRFTMGCSPNDNNCLADEKPPHEVTLSHGFWMGETEITVNAYKRYTAATGHPMPPDVKFGSRDLNPGWGNPNMPIVGINWAAAADYCGWAGGRLPTEAEWEYAARGGTTSSRYGEIEDIAWVADNSGRSHIDSTALWNADQKTYWDKLNDNGDGIHEVARKRPNTYGLYDILGNISEWVSDWYDEKYYQNSPSVDPQGPSTGTQRILRSWCWFNSPFSVRVSRRGGVDPNSQGNACGGRCILPAIPSY